MNKNIKIALIATLLVYSSGLLYTYYSNNQFNERIALYDTDKNGIINGKEITRNSIPIVKQMAKRKTTNQAVLILIPFSIIIGSITFAIVFLFKKIKNIDDHEINYGKQKK